MGDRRKNIEGPRDLELSITGHDGEIALLCLSRHVYPFLNHPRPPKAFHSSTSWLLRHSHRRSCGRTCRARSTLHTCRTRRNCSCWACGRAGEGSGGQDGNDNEEVALHFGDLEDVATRVFGSDQLITLFLAGARRLLGYD